jgi:hypothetical protein
MGTDIYTETSVQTYQVRRALCPRNSDLYTHLSRSMHVCPRVELRPSEGSMLTHQVPRPPQRNPQ